MSNINDLNTTNTLEDDDKLVVWKKQAGATRAITAVNAAAYFQDEISGNFQPYNAFLANIASLGPSTAPGLYFEITGVDTADLITGANLLSNIGGLPADPTLVAIGALTVADGDYIQATGVDTFRARKLQVATYAALQAIAAASRFDDMVVYTASRASDGDGGQGDWRFDASSSAAANGGTILAPDAGTGRWIKQVAGKGYQYTWFTSEANAVATALADGAQLEITANLTCTAQTATGVQVLVRSGVTVTNPGNWAGAQWFFEAGYPAAAVGSKMKIGQLLSNIPSARLEDLAAIWPAGDTEAAFAVEHEFDALANAGDSPRGAIWAYALNNNSGNAAVAYMGIAHALTASDSAFAGNFLAINSPGVNGAKLIGAEFDVEPTSGTTVGSGSAGIYINAFNVPSVGAALQTGGVSTGTFTDGLILGGLAASGAGVALQSAGSADSLINSTAGTYTTAAVLLGSGASRGIRWTSGTTIYDDGGNDRYVMGRPNFIFRNASDTVSLTAITSDGSVDIQGGGAFKIAGTTVLNGRAAVVSAPTGGATQDAEARTAINAIISRLQGIGIMGT